MKKKHEDKCYNLKTDTQKYAKIMTSYLHKYYYYLQELCYCWRWPYNVAQCNFSHSFEVNP